MRTSDPEKLLDASILKMMEKDSPKKRYYLTIQKIRMGEHWTTIAMLTPVETSNG